MFLSRKLDLNKLIYMSLPLNATSQSELLIEFRNALDDILAYWKNTTDEKHGGFVGRIDEHEQRIEDAEKGAVLNARILWSFSAAYNFTGEQQYLDLSHRCFLFINDKFIDKQFGGVFWSVDYTGKPLQTKKQTYAVSFAIYGLAEYYKASANEQALHMAQAFYYDLEKHTYDVQKGGYLEAFTRDWQSIDDLRLSDKDANERKTMNTHLHVLEGYTNLYRVWPNESLKESISKLIANFTNHIIGQDGHLGLFFNDDWELKSHIISYGHDIEAAWLIQEAAEAIADEALVEQTKGVALQIASATKEGLASNGGLNYELDKASNHLNAEKHWWVQAEAMVGVLNAWQLSEQPEYFQQFIAVWEFTKAHLIDRKAGEWFWGVDENNNRMQGEDKAGLWKCPYHNSRACLEVLKRLS